MARKLNHVTRRQFLGIGALALAAATRRECEAQAPAPRDPMDRPNIIFILSDDLSYRDLGCYGQTKIATPHIDQLAQEGLLFTQAYAGAAECAPTRCSLMTGMHMGHARVRLNSSVRGQEHLLPEDVTVAEVLKKAGYTTGMIGKWGIGTPGTTGVPYKQGFDLSYGFYDQGRAHTYYPYYVYRNQERITLEGNYGFNMKRMYERNRAQWPYPAELENTYDAEGRFVPDSVPDPTRAVNSEALFQEEAMKFVRQNRANPFFLYYATQIPHGPLVAKDMGAYKDDPDFPTLRHREWAAMISWMDAFVGKLVAQLRESGIDKNTLILFAGDNGYSAWGYFVRKRFEDDAFFQNKGPFRGGKFVSQEGGLRVPMIACWPGTIGAGLSTDHVCAFWDFLATAADLAGVNPPKTDGVSFAPTLLGKPEEQRAHEYLYWETKHEQAVRLDNWRGYRPHPSKPTELYDIVNDTFSRNNVAQDHPELVAHIEAIFAKARTDSEWYVNPGESKESVHARTKRAEEAGLMIHSPRPNGLPDR